MDSFKDSLKDSIFKLTYNLYRHSDRRAQAAIAEEEVEAVSERNLPKRQVQFSPQTSRGPVQK